MFLLWALPMLENRPSSELCSKTWETSLPLTSATWCAWCVCFRTRFSFRILRMILFLVCSGDRTDCFLWSGNCRQKGKQSSCPWNLPCLEPLWESFLYKHLKRVQHYMVHYPLPFGRRTPSKLSFFSPIKMPEVSWLGLNVLFCLCWSDTPGLHIFHRILHLLSPDEMASLHPRKCLKPFIAPSPFELTNKAMYNHQTEMNAGESVTNWGKQDNIAGCYEWGSIARIELLEVPQSTKVVFYTPKVLKIKSMPLPARPGTEFFALSSLLSQ